jgi:hypothetical protein
MDTKEQIPLDLPLLKGGIPLFGKEGLPACAKPLRRRQGGDFRKNMSFQLGPP